MARLAARGARLPARSRARAPSRSPSATSPSSRDFARDELGLAELAAWDVGLRVARSCSEARYAFSDQEVKQYFPEDQRARRPVPRRRDAVRRRRSALRPAPAWHPACASSRSRDRRGALVGQFYLDLYARAGQARRRVDGRRDQAPAHANGDVQHAGRVPHVQLRRARRRQAGAVHARRSDDAVPRVRPRPASAADAASTSPGVSGHRRRRMGRGRAAQPVHGELLLGMGRASRT